METDKNAGIFLGAPACGSRRDAQAIVWAIANSPGRTLARPFVWQCHFAMGGIREPKTNTTSAKIIVRSDIRGYAGGNIDQNGIPISRIEIAGAKLPIQQSI